MFNGPETITLSLVGLALDAGVMRQQAIAHNIANAHTAGFAPARVDFESQLGAVRSRLKSGQAVTPELLHGVAPRVTRGPWSAEAAGTAGLDREAAAVAQNTLHYQALLKALNRHISIMSAAVTEGKR